MAEHIPTRRVIHTIRKQIHYMNYRSPMNGHGTHYTTMDRSLWSCSCRFTTKTQKNYVQK